jgi:hypothetical protein
VKAKSLCLSLLLLMAASPAHADPVKDFKTGTAAKVAAATVIVGAGARTSTGGATFTKSADSLDFELKASDFGVSLPLTLRMRGTARGAGLIEYNVDQTYSPSVQLGEGHYVSRVTGRVHLRARPLPGLLTHDVGNTSLAIAQASSLVAYGDFGTLTIAIKELDVLGGVKQPPLERISDTTSRVICSDRVATYHAFSVLLANVAKGTGAVVDLSTPRRAGVRMPPSIVVPTGQRSRTVDARIEPNFVGTVRVTASAGGTARSLDVVVRPRASCAP